MTETANNNESTSIRIGREVVNSPKVSVIIPAYKIAEFIAETLDSVFIQTFYNFETIVINDGSPDTEEFERALAPYLEKIVYLKQPNLGAGAARNFGIETARGDFIAFLDGDDVWNPEFLESQLNFLETNNLDFVYSDALIFGGSALEGENYMQGAPSEGEVNFENLLDLRCQVITSGVVARKKNVVQAGMFEIEKVRAHDFVLWLKIARNGAKMGYQRKILLKYRVHLDSLSGNSIQRVQREIDVFERVKTLISLNGSEQKIVQNQLIRLNAEIEIEKGKSFLLQENFDAARAAFEKGNLYRQSKKLRLIIFLLKISPRLLLRYYKSQRADEIAFIPSN